jgi:hypothetical protein
VIRRFKRGETIAPALRRLVASGRDRDFADREGIERAVIRLLS